MRAHYREAFQLIRGSSPPDDFRLHVLRARALAGLRRRGEADHLYSALQKQRPDDAQIQLETHRNRAYLAATRDRWKECAEEFSRASTLRPEDACLWNFRTVAKLAARDANAYRDDCRQMLRKFQQTTDAFSAHQVVTACILREDSLVEMAALIPLAKLAATLHHGNGRMLGAAYYRAGAYSDALRCFEQSARLLRPSPADLCFLAMTYHRLGRSAEAFRCLKQAEDWIERGCGGT